MTARRFWWGIALLVIVLAGAGAALIINRAPATSAVTVVNCLRGAEADCLRFPTVSGSNLLDEALTLPQDFEGDYVFVIMPFDDGQQVRAQSWLAPVQALAAQHPGLAYYNTAIFTNINPAVRVFIRAGMVVAIPDEALRRVTLTVFLEDRAAFLDALAIPDIDQMQVFLLNAAGEVLWRGRGEYDAAQGEALAALLAQAR